MNKTALFSLGALIGGVIGGYIPSLWGADLLSGWGILLSTLGGFAGVWVTYRLSKL